MKQIGAEMDQVRNFGGDIAFFWLRDKLDLKMEVFVMCPRVWNSFLSQFKRFKQQQQFWNC
jgi:hypothetical protein